MSASAFWPVQTEQRALAHPPLEFSLLSSEAKCEIVRVERSASEAMPHIVEGFGAWREAVPATPRVLHVIGCLTHGGAERQLATYAAAAHARGLASHSVLTFHPAEGAGAHFRPLLESAGVRIRALRDPPSQSALHAINTDMKLRTRMADSLVKLLTNRSLRAQFSRNARIFAAERFGLEDMVRATDALYR